MRVTGSLAARRELVSVCRRLYDRGLIAGPDGNVSVLATGRLLVTPSGMSKVDVAATDLVAITMSGRAGTRRRRLRIVWSGISGPTTHFSWQITAR